MKSHVKESRLFWLGCGVIGGLCVAYFWPHEQAYASATDRDAKFAICTVETGPQLPEAVFVLDFTTGRLQGGMLNPQAGVFANRWYANVSQDFKLGAKGGGGKYTMIPGSGFFDAQRQWRGRRRDSGIGDDLYRRTDLRHGRLLPVLLPQPGW